MAIRPSTRTKFPKPNPLSGITQISVSGYKSIAKECTIDIRPLTILAGVNSSGKSSIMQPILMLKQTLQDNADPGPLKISMPHVFFTAHDQYLSKIGNKYSKELKITVETHHEKKVSLFFHYPKKGIEISKNIFYYEGIEKICLSCGEKDIFIEPSLISLFTGIEHKSRNLTENHFDIGRSRCSLTLTNQEFPLHPINLFSHIVSDSINKLFHIPGLRGLPERLYPRYAVNSGFPGPFLVYVASIILDWQDSKSDKFETLKQYLEKTGLTWNIKAIPVNDVQIEIKVGRLPHHTDDTTIDNDMVNIADVGFGVSQTLPVLVALLTAEPGQMVYLEQPELHLHPRAQVALAEIIAEVANTGVKVILETHSPLLILTIQTLVAETKIKPDFVRLYWFERQKNGITKVTQAELDENGAYGDWPEDFGDIELGAESRYLNASLK